MDGAGQEELKWFEENFDHLCNTYPNEWLVIKGNKVIAHTKVVGEIWPLLKQTGNDNFIVQASREAWERPLLIHQGVIH